LADVKKAVGMFQNPKINIPIIGLVENMSYFSPEDMPDKKYYIFGKGGTEKLSQEKEIEFLGSLPIIEQIRVSCDSGSPISLDEGSESAILFKELSEKVAQQISIINNKKEPKPEETTA
ncbi:MAG: P-loop NTPase, partial [Bacteroidia bacterium]|nr:P-loop NTPase [Bacteroidia bacterium]